MEAKEFLRQYQNILTDIRNMESEVGQLEDMAMSVTGHVEMANIRRGKNKNGKDIIERQVLERVSSSGSNNGTADLIAKICDMKIEIMNRRTLALNKLQKIERAISKVENKDYRQLLHRRYIEGNTWEEIAVGMKYSFRHVLRMHGGALQEIERIINVS